MQVAHAMQEIDLMLKDYQCDLPTGSDTLSIRLGDVLGNLRSGSFLLPGLLLAAPFIQPFSLGPLATACSLAFILMGWQILRGDPSLILPRKLESLSIPLPLWCKLLRAAKRISRFCDRFTAVRHTRLTDGVYGARYAGIMIITGGLLMIIPFIGVPLNNTFPALMILCALLGLNRRDGLMSLLSLFWGIVSVIYFALITTLLFFSGKSLLHIFMGS